MKRRVACGFSATVGNKSVPIQLAQCRFPALAISSAKILIYFSNKKYGSNFIKQHSETVMVRNYQNADCSRPIESQIGARGMTLTGPPAGCLTHE